jgi:hypothetical protein
MILRRMPPPVWPAKAQINRRIFSPRRPVFAFLGRLGKYDPLRYFELHGSCDRSAAILLATHHETASELTLNSQKTGYFGDRIQSLSVGLDLCLSLLAVSITYRDFGERGSDRSSLIHVNSRVFSLRMGPRIPCGSDAIDLNSWMRSARNASVRAAMEKLVKLFKKQKSRFYWYDFTVRGHRYRGSTNETKAVRASKVAQSEACRSDREFGPASQKIPVLLEFSRRFLQWLDNARREDKTKIYYRNGWRLLRVTAIVGMRLDQITTDVVDSQGHLRIQIAGSERCGACFTSRRVEADSSRSQTKANEGIRAKARKSILPTRTRSPSALPIKH